MLLTPAHISADLLGPPLLAQAPEQFDLATIDFAIVVVYFVGVLFHGWWVSRKGNEDSEDYFLAGKTLPWYLIGFSLYASNMSGASFVGLMGAAYNNGIAVFNYEWTATVVLIFFSLFMLPYFLRAGLFTIPEYLETRFDKRSRYAFSAFTIMAIIFIDTAGALYAGGLVMTRVFAVDLWLAVAVLAFVAGAYTILGGLSAVVVTDTVQSILLIIGGIAIFVLALGEVGGWTSFLNQVSEVQPRAMELYRPAGADFTPWLGLPGVILLGFYYWTLNQFIVQRTLGADNLDQGRKGALWAGFLKIPNLFIIIVPGAIAILIYPNLENADLVFPTLAFDLLPIGLRGLVMAALIAAIMSSLDSALNAASSLVTMDFVAELRPATSQQALVRIGRITTAIIMVIAAVYAPSIASFQSLFGYFQSALSFVTPPIIAVYLAGLFIKRLNATAAFYTILSGLVIGTPLFIMTQVTSFWTDTLGLPTFQFLYWNMAMFVLGFIAMLVISAAGETPDREAMREITFTRDNWEKDVLMRDQEEDLVWYRDFRAQCVMLLAVTVAVIGWFWV
ncbi:MAG: sodium:solute symporter [Actinobacteria bacterium]|nr:sodium:solute symporter [Actinomycetota bacterium]